MWLGDCSYVFLEVSEYVHTQIRVYVCVYIYAYVSIYLCVSMYVCIYMFLLFTDNYTHIYVHVHLIVCVSINIYIYEMFLFLLGETSASWRTRCDSGPARAAPVPPAGLAVLYTTPGLSCDLLRPLIKISFLLVSLWLYYNTKKKEFLKR